MRWIQGGLRFECQPDCGQCCTQSVFGSGDQEGVFLTKRDIRRLHQAGLSWAVEGTRGEPNRRLLEDNGTCVFLDPETRGCTIYAVRPTQCRNFPFSPGKDSPVRTRSQWSEAAKHCPGIGVGRFYPKSLIRTLVRRRRAHGSFQV